MILVSRPLFIIFMAGVSVLLLAGCCGEIPKTTKKIDSRLAKMRRNNSASRLEQLAEQQSTLQKKRFSISLQGVEESPISQLKYRKFNRLDPSDESKSRAIRSFNPIRHLSLDKVTENPPLSNAKLHQKLFYQRNRAKISEGLIQVDDFYPLMEEQFSWFYPHSADFIYWQKEHDGKPLSPISTTSNLMNADSFFGYPMGYSTQKAFIPYALDCYLLFFNQKALDVYNILKVDKSKNNEEKELDEYSFNEFVQYLEQRNLKFYYPDPFSSSEGMREHGLSFFCQLLYWTNPQLYKETLLGKNKSPKINSAFKTVLKWLKQHQSSFIPSKSIDEMLDSVIHENLLKHLPAALDPDDIPEKYAVPEDYWDELESTLCFAFLPESSYLKPFISSEDKFRNKEIYDEIKKQREAKRRAKAERKKRKGSRKKGKRKGRKKRSRSKKAQPEETEETEEKEPQKKEIEKPTPIKPKIITSASQLFGLVIDKSIGRRKYLAIPQNASNKEASLFTIRGMLKENIQKSLSRQGIFLRSIRKDINGELQLLKMTSTDRKKSRSKNIYFTLEPYLPQDYMSERFIPVLNAFYLRTMLNYKKRPK